MKDMRTAKQCADYFKEQAEAQGMKESPIKEWYIRKLIENGDIPVFSVGKKRLVCPTDIEDFIERNVH